jgi:DNA polymerase-3 subunit gamma/tau
MGQALYRSYRPRKLSEVVGQDHVTKTLGEALKQGRISHAYLLTGPRGVGKTSIARILAHEINDLPYKDDSAHIDIIEIDAASNRRIDEIRELRDKVYVAPAEAKYKVYIIDEVHMLTREAFNALLKTLEEPPEHVVFILATTDAHKLPETIISRTQRFSFKPVSKTDVVKHLAELAKKEKIKASTEALELLAEHGEGSFRDSISMLDQARNQGKKLERADLQQLLGVPPDEAIQSLLQAVAGGSDTAALMDSLTSLYDQGYQPAAIAKQLGQAIRAELTSGMPSLPIDEAMALLADLIGVPASHDPARLLEIVVLRAAKPAGVSKPAAASPPEAAVADEQPATPVAKPLAKKQAKPVPKSAKSSKALDDSLWSELLDALKRQHNTLYGIVRMAQPQFDGNTIRLLFAFPFHQKRINEANNQRILIDTVQELTGQPVTIECVLDETITPPKVNPKPSNNPATAEVTAISNIFGDAELLES